jgi:uncharacterized repeat protein (TIGR01451 family)
MPETLRVAVRRLAFLLFAVLAFASANAAAQVTALYYDQIPAPGGFWTEDVRTLRQGVDSFEFTSLTSSSFSLNVFPSDTSMVSLRLSPPIGESFTLGPQELVNDFSSGQAAGLSATLPGFSVFTNSGRFVVLELVYDSSLNLVSFAADFEQQDTAGNVVYGEVRFNSSIPLTVDKPASSTAPDAFEFLPDADVNPGSVQLSNTITVYGTNAPSPVSIAGGEYSVNGGPFTAEPGFASNRDHIVVRATASSAYGTTTTATLTVGGVSASFDMTTFTPGAPFTAIQVQSDTPANVGLGSGNFFEARAPQWTIGAQASDGHHVIVNLTGINGAAYRFEFDAPLDAMLAPGPYEMSYRAPFAEASPGFSFTASPCFEGIGRFVIHELTLGSGGSVDKFAASFEQACTSGAPVYGEIRINSSVPLPSMVTSPDATPDAFAIQSRMPVRAGALVRSNWFEIWGANQPVPISITGGQYSVNGGAFTSAPGVVHLKDVIVVQATASRWPGAVKSVVVTAGGRSAAMTITTYQSGMALTGLYFQSPNGDFIGAGQNRIYLAPTDGLTLAPSFAPGLEADVKGLGGDSWTLNLAAPGGGTLVPGSYPDAARWSFQESTSPGLAFTGNGRACNEVAGSFVITEAEYAGDGTPQRFAVDFDQQCELTGPTLHGELRFNSTVPISVLTGNECTDSDPSCLADISIAQSAPATAWTGKDLVMQLTASNAGPGTATNLVVTDLIPAGSTFVWASPACAFASGSVGCNIASLAPGASVPLTVVVRPGAAGPATNDVTLSADPLDEATSNNASTASITVNASPAGEPVLRYRLYTPVTQEHLYTTDLNERDTLAASGGWVAEGDVGHVLDNPGSFNGVVAVPYYRLYDAATYRHHWTTDPNEYYTLVQFPNWHGEGVDGFILPTDTAGATQLYRLMYPFVPGLHHWTIDANEYNTLISTYGWVGEGGSGFVIQ